MSRAQPVTGGLLLPGRHVGAFEIVRRLAVSGQGSLYLVRPWPALSLLRLVSRQWLMLRLKRAVTPAFVARHRIGVLKLAHPAYEANLHDEHEYLSGPLAAHPHLVQPYSRYFGDAGRRSDLAFVDVMIAGRKTACPYIVLAFECGGSLAALMQRRGGRPLAPAAAVAVVLQAARALRHLHSRLGVVHHDLKPANLLLHAPATGAWSGVQRIVLADLGAAESLRCPRHRGIYGTRRYLPPERLRGDPATLSPQVDIYGLGIVLYELLTGRPAPHRDATSQYGYAPRRHNQLVSPALDALVQAATDPDPRRRAAALPDMRSLIEQLSVLPETGHMAAAAPQYRRTGQRLVLLVVLILTLLGSSLLIFASGGLPLPLAGFP